MGEATKIEWAHHTFNPWRGCTHVSPGCTNCYAETLAARFPGTHGSWGAGGARVVSSDAYWRQPIRWNRAAAAAGERHRVFCASLADVFEDRPDLVEPRRRLWDLVLETPDLDWLLLTKRPENVAPMLGPRGLNFYAVEGPVPCPQPNVWIGTSVEDQRRADERLPHLLNAPAAVRFLSCEPLLGPLDLSDWLGLEWYDSMGWGREMFASLEASRRVREGLPPDPSVDWIIVGGESGAGARPMDLDWARSLVDQGRTAGAAVFVKQLGARPLTGMEGRGLVEQVAVRDRKGGDPDEWPGDLRVREFPASAVRA